MLGPCNVAVTTKLEKVQTPEHAADRVSRYLCSRFP